MNWLEKILNHLFSVDHAHGAGTIEHRHDHGLKIDKPYVGTNRKAGVQFRFPAQFSRILLSLTSLQKQRQIHLIGHSNHRLK